MTVLLKHGMHFCHGAAVTASFNLDFFFYFSYFPFLSSSLSSTCVLLSQPIFILPFSLSPTLFLSLQAEALGSALQAEMEVKEAIQIQQGANGEVVQIQMPVNTVGTWDTSSCTLSQTQDSFTYTDASLRFCSRSTWDRERDKDWYVWVLKFNIWVDNHGLSPGRGS